MYRRIRPRFLLLFPLLLLVLAGCGPRQSSIPENQGLNLRRFEGTTINFIANKHPWIELIDPRLEQFATITGIEVELAVYPEEQFRTKRTVELVSGVSKLDLFMMMPGNSLDAYVSRGWVEALTPYMKDETAGWPDYDWEDIFPVALEVGLREGVNYTLPVMLETSLLAYNRDILSRYNVSPPTTMAELEEAAAEIYSASGGEIFGITMRGKHGAASSQWIDFVRSFGGDWLDEEGVPDFSSSPVMAATRYYGRLLRRYGPPSAPSNGWYESTSLFMQGRAAMIYDASVFKSHYENPNRSRVAGKVGYLPIPEGPAGSVPHISSWGLAINSGSDKKGAAWLFMQWAAGERIALDGLEAGIPSCRQSAWESPGFRRSESATDWIEASLASYDRASTRWNPPVIDINSGREIVGELIVAAILGRNLELQAERSSRRMSELMRQERMQVSE